jgi:hypothetical protein
VALFGTRFTIESDFFGALGDVEVVRPSPEETDYIHRTYIEIVNAGRGPMSQETGLRNLANTLCRRDNVEAIVLAGTELNLIFNNGNTDFPTIDCARVHIDGIIRQLYASNPNGRLETGRSAKACPFAVIPNCLALPHAPSGNGTLTHYPVTTDQEGKRRPAPVAPSFDPHLSPPCRKPPHNAAFRPPIRRCLHDTGKSLFLWDCVVGLRGLELPTNRLSAARSEHRAMGHLVGFRAIGREVGALFLRVALLCRKKNPRPRMETISDRVSARDAKENLVTIMEDYRG